MKTWLALGLIAFSSTAFASNRKALENYSATDDSGSAIEADDAADSSDNAAAAAEGRKAQNTRVADDLANDFDRPPVPPTAPIKGVAVNQPAPAPAPVPVAQQSFFTAKPAAAPVAAAPLAPVAKTYDRVPQDQIDPVLTRLQLVEEIVRRFGRAYDYRTHTVRELEAILQQLKMASLDAKL